VYGTRGPGADEPGAGLHLSARGSARPIWTGPLRAFVRRRGAIPLVCALVVAALVTTLGPSAHLYAVTHNADTFAPSAVAGMQDLASLEAAGNAALLAPATAPPAPAPPSLASAPPLKAHEVFGFAPYWTLDQAAGFNLAGISTLAYFAVGVNPDGTLDQSGPGWTGYESQALANLVTQAHAAGDRVVLTVNNFDQGQLDALTSSPTAAATLAAAVLAAVEAKNLDGVNLDLEGQGAGDNAGLTRLVDTVSWVMHSANPHYQVTMDTYSSSASGTNGWFDIPALAGAVDAFFVMEYNPNLAAAQGPSSPLTSGMFSDQTAADEYAAVVPPSKVILGVPFFGIDWPTSDGTLHATATGAASDVSLGDIDASGHHQYWDPVTESGWTSYQVGTQWHETFFEDPASLYAVAQLAQAHSLAGVGIWTLGMDANAPTDLAALLGFAPAVKDGPAGPASTSASPPAATSPAPPTPSPTNSSAPSNQTTTSAPPSSTTTTTTAPAPTTTTSSTTTTLPPLYGGRWNGTVVALTKVTGTPPAVSGSSPVGQLTGFETQDATMNCLTQEPDLHVWAVSGSTDQYLVVAAPPADCTTVDFVFTAT
jgi:spore germination protein YaaH